MTGHRRHHGFTLTELLVALAITAIIVLAINRVFSVTVTAVSRGVATSQVFSASRVIGDQLVEDAEAMTGPDRGGFIVIIGKEETGADIAVRDDGSAITADVRTDQLLFIRDRETLEPIAPGASNSYDSQSVAPFCRIWYGHVLRTDSQGVAGSGLGDSNNALAKDWVLGRQALFLQPSSGSGAQALVARHSDSVLGSDLADALYDVAQASLVDLDPNDPSNVAMVAASGDLTPPSPMLGLGLTGDDYLDRALDFTFDADMLQCNPIPPSPFTSDQVAKMHTYLSGRISQFIVEFAGDYDTTDGMDVIGTPQRIKWYGFDSVHTPDFVTYQGDANSPLIEQYPPVADVKSTPAKFVFRHGPVGEVNWPLAIRVRYRVHDANDRVRGADGELGRWFEQIIPVEGN